MASVTQEKAGSIIKWQTGGSIGLLSHASGGLDTAAGCSVMMLLVNNYLLTTAGTVHKAALCS